MNLLKAMFTVSGLTFLSRITGLLREILAAHWFGAGLIMDAFNVAFRIPNMLRRLFAEGAFSQAFVPILGEYYHKKGHDETRLLISRTTTLLGTILFIVSVVGIFISPQLVYLFSAGFKAIPGKFELTTQLLQIVFPYIFLISLSCMFASVLNTVGAFALAAFASTLLNVAIIGTVLIAGHWFKQPVMAMAWGVTLGGILQVTLLGWGVRKYKLLPSWSWKPSDPATQRILKLMIPSLFGVSVSQVSLLINTHIASTLSSGSVSWVTFADRLMEFPSALLGVAAGTIILPQLIKHHQSQNTGAYNSLLDWGLRTTLMMSVPSAVALHVIGIPLIATLFMHGHFNARDAIQTHFALSAYSIGLCGIILVKVLAPAFYARQDIKTPVKLGILALIIAQLSNTFTVPLFAHAGLALSTGLSACVNALLLAFTLYKRGIYSPEPGWGKVILKTTVAVIIMASVLSFFKGNENNWFHYSNIEKVIRLLGLVVAGISAYFISLRCLGFKPSDFIRKE
ncbi:MAG: murein biosynthesis integral membrane protein MurJ [Pseudomonadota bacterium]